MRDMQSDPVDDLKRRARRRLVGAIVLAVAAAVIVPMFLESDPKPLGQDVQVQIPPINGDRFINRLTPQKDRDTPPPGAPTAAEATKPAAEATKPNGSAATNAAVESAAPKPEAPALAASPQRPSPVTSAATAPAAGAKPSDNSSDQPATKSAVKPVVNSVANSVIKPEAKAPSSKADATKSQAPGAKPAAAVVVVAAKSAAKDDAFVVQLAAYAEPATARALERKLKKAGFPAYTEALKTSHGALTRVRVGPYATREAADSARAKLKTAGQNGLVVPAR